MTDDEFADDFFNRAADQGHGITTHGNIKCPNDKNISKRILKKIHKQLGKDCPDATAGQLKGAGISTCCFTIFRDIARQIYP